MMMTAFDIVFFALAGITLAAATWAITRRSALSGALWLIAALAGVSGLYGLLAAPVIAVLSLLIAAGAVMVLIVFVIMIVDMSGRKPQARRVTFTRIVGAMTAGYLAMVMSVSVARPPFMSPPETGEYYQSASTLGRLLLDRYLLPFELTGFLLLAATVSLTVIAGRKKGEVEPDEDVVESISEPS